MRQGRGRRAFLACAIALTVVLSAPLGASGTLGHEATSYATSPSPFESAIGDLDGDGDLDVAMPHYGTHVTVQLNDGDGTFTPAPYSPITPADVATAYPRSVAIADFDRDGDMDLLVISTGIDGKGQLFVNNGGSFTGAASFNVGFLAGALAVGDINRDGILDLLVANSSPTAQAVSFIGDGNGAFASIAGGSTSLPSTPLDLVLADFNRDGKLDFAAANGGTSNVSIRLGDGTGLFSGTTDVAVGNSPDQLQVGDVNRDGMLDLAVNVNPGSVRILRGSGTGTFSIFATCICAANHSGVALGDIDDDGFLDLVITDDHDPDPDPTLNHVSVLTGDGTGVFLEADGSPLVAGGPPRKPELADFDRDGVLDIVTANGGDASAAMTVFLLRPDQDTTDPDTFILSGPSGPTNDTTPSFAFVANEEGATFECLLDGVVTSDCTSPFDVISPLAEGQHTFSVVATDRAGNQDPSPATRMFTVDAQGPVVTIVGPTKTTKTRVSFTFTFQNGEIPTQVRCKIDGGNFKLCGEEGYTTPKLSRRQHTLTVQAFDEAGNFGQDDHVFKIVRR